MRRRYGKLFIAVAAAVSGSACADVLGLNNYYNLCGGEVDAPDTCALDGGATGGAGGAASQGGGGDAPACTKPADCGDTPHGQASCEHGHCAITCDEGYGDCDPEKPGCETKLDSLEHCGTCATSCSAFCVDQKCNDPTAVSAAASTTCALLADGTVWCWGINQNGELGVGDKKSRRSPTKVALPEKATAIAVNGTAATENRTVTHACAVLASGAVDCWGVDVVTGNPVLTPTSTSVTTGQALALLANDNCVVTSAKALVCWGSNAFTPQLVTVDTDVVVGSGGDGHVCYIKNDQTLWCLGYDDSGQLGNGVTSDMLSTMPSKVFLPGGLDKFESVAARAVQTCATASTGAFCWGLNDGGQLGTGNTTDADKPTPIAVPGAKFVSLGDNDGAAVGDHVYVWGANNAGQLGDGTSISVTSPKRVSIDGVLQFALGFEHSCALTTKGILCWGANDEGQLGTGTTSGSSHPVPVRWPTSP